MIKYLGLFNLKFIYDTLTIINCMSVVSPVPFISLCGKRSRRSNNDEKPLLWLLNIAFKAIPHLQNHFIVYALINARYKITG
jgi:hypothetical protein